MLWTRIPGQDHSLRLWFRYVGLVGSQRLASVQPACLGVTTTPLPIRDGDLLRILAELPHASTIQQAAAACAMSERTLKRKLTTLRVTLGIPATGVTRYRPPELAALLWTALDTFLVATSVLCAQDAAETRGGIDCGYDNLIRSLPASSRTFHCRAVSAHEPG